MARSTDGVGAVLVELLANRLRTAHVRFDGRDVRRRRLRRLTEQPIHHERSARNRGRRRAVGGDLQDRCLSHEAPTRTIRWQINSANLRADDSLNAVMHRQLLVQHREFGAYKMRGIEVVVDQLAEVRSCFGDHRVLEVRVEFGIQLTVRIGRSNLP